MKIILYFKVKIINNQHFLMRMRTKMTGECTRISKAYLQYAQQQEKE